MRNPSRPPSQRISLLGWRRRFGPISPSTLSRIAIFARGDQLPGLIHHSGRGVQYLAIRYTERLAEAGVVNSVGSKGDSYDTALAETVNGLQKTVMQPPRPDRRSGLVCPGFLGVA